MASFSLKHSPLPRAIWALGFVSLLMDVSSELIHSLLPLFVVSTLGVSVAALGFLEGLAEATALFCKMFSGVLSDWIGKRKILAVLGYGLSAVTKPLFPLATSFSWVVAARLIDRAGKGIRGAPRDALVGELAPAALRGAAYGLRQSLDNVGAFVGPGLATLLMLLWANDIRAVYWFAILPGALAVLLLIFGVQEPARKNEGKASRFPISRAELAKLSPAFWRVVAVGGVLTLARFSEAFLILRAQNVGMPSAWIPMIMVVMSVVYALAAYPVGILSDQLGRRALLIVGTGILILADLTLAASSGMGTLLLGVALWGLHMGFSQGLLATLVADTTPEDRRGTAFGLFNLVSGAALLAASALAGFLWDACGPSATFLAGAALAALALAGFVLVRPSQNHAGKTAAGT